MLDGVDVEAPLEGTLLVIKNDDQPGVIGQVGTILGRHGVNIASFALGRDEAGAVGVVKVDATPDDAGLATCASRDPGGLGGAGSTGREGFLETCGQAIGVVPPLLAQREPPDSSREKISELTASAATVPTR